MTKVYYQILHLPLEEDGYYPAPTSEDYFRPWVELAIEVDGRTSMLQLPSFLLSPDEEDFFYTYLC